MTQTAAIKSTIFPVTGKIYFRESTKEWVLELQSVINDHNITVRHPQPGVLKPEEVLSLPASDDDAEKKIEMLSWLENELLGVEVLYAGDKQVHQHDGYWVKAEALKLVNRAYEQFNLPHPER